MAKFKKYEIGEDFLGQIDLKNYLGPNHRCKQIEQIVSELDLSLMERAYSNQGQQAFHPKMLLTIIFYGYTIGVRSGRKLAGACKEHVAFIYLSKGHQVSKSVINDFRKNNYQHFSNLFDQVLQKCIDAQMGDPGLSIVDGSKIRANSAKRRTKTKTKYEKWQQHLLADIASIEEELSTCERSIEKGEIKKN